MTNYKHHVHYPEGYENDPDRRWPVLITLHGAGERNVALAILKNHHYYLPMYELTASRYPMLVVVPLCPPRQYWEPPLLNDLVDELLRDERIDEDRIYMNGFSMGGYGTWLTAGRYPDRFAAISPVCGGGDPRDASRLKDIPTWAFHGAQDPVVPVEETLGMIEAITAAGGHPKLTIYAEGDHGVWDETYANPELYEWLLQHRRSERMPFAA
ncbi:MAG: carboxylesterase family protein [Armatimonadota bacterium]